MKQLSLPSYAVAVVAFLTLSSCEKVPLTAPTQSTITVVVSSTTVPINGSVDVIATVLESSGTAVHNGTLVTFTASFGRFEPTESLTKGGTATVKFFGTSSGTTKITAISGGAKGEVTDVKVGGAAAGSVAVRSEPPTLPQGGGSAQIIAIVRDGGGNPLPGAPINFTADQGGLSATAAITDASGEARVTLTTNRDARVTASAAGASSVTASADVRIINAPSVTLALATGTTAAVGVPTNFTVTPAAVTGGASIQSVTINWGDGSPEQALGAISGATNVTHTFATAANYNVVATARDATGQQSQSTAAVNVQRVVPTVTITPSTGSTSAGGVLAFSVAATPGTGGPAIQRVTVVQNPGGSTVYSGSTGGSFVRTFPTAGTHTLIATATDQAGTSGTGTAVVTVGNLEATLTASGSGLTCSGTPVTCTGLTANTNITFTATLTSSGVVASSYEWTWGDGTPIEVTSARFNSHRYASAASNVVQVTITTSTGATVTQILFLRP